MVCHKCFDTTICKVLLNTSQGNGNQVQRIFKDQKIALLQRIECLHTLVGPLSDNKMNNSI